MRAVVIDFVDGSSRNAQIGLIGEFEAAIETILRLTGEAPRYCFVNETTFVEWLDEIDGRMHFTAVLEDQPDEPQKPELLGEMPQNATWRGYILGLACWTFPSDQRKGMVL